MLAARSRFDWFRTILVSATFLGLVASTPLWLSTRLFPTIPIVRGLPGPPAPWDRLLFGTVLLTLLLALGSYRKAVPACLVGLALLVLLDQNRLQPWLYLYWIALLVGLLPAAPATAGARLLLSAVYFWSGVQKLNDRFFEEVVPWFLDSVPWLPDALVPFARFAISLAAPLEILIGLGVWSRRLRAPALVAAFLLHGAVLVFLGPVGRGYNLVVWPWNLSMPLLLLAAFPRGAIRDTFRDVRRSAVATAAVAMFWLLPVLSYFGRWDSALSFRVYSGNLTRADVLVSEDLRQRLPAAIARFVRVNEAGSLSVDVLDWALTEMRVPPLAEPRGYRAIGAYLARYASGPSDVRVVVAPPHGPMKTYRQNELAAPAENR